METMEPPEFIPTAANCQYWYVTYTALGIIMASAVVVQKRRIENQPDPEGFNIAEASQYLMRCIEVPCIVLGWTEITKQRGDEMKRWGDSVAAAQNGYMPNKGGHLQLVPKPTDAPSPDSPPKGA